MTTFIKNIRFRTHFQLSSIFQAWVILFLLCWAVNDSLAQSSPPDNNKLLRTGKSSMVTKLKNISSLELGSCPDLQAMSIRYRFQAAKRNRGRTRGRGRVNSAQKIPAKTIITAVMQNTGSSDYVSRINQQSMQLYINRRLVKSEAFVNSYVDQAQIFTYEHNGHLPDGTVIQFVISYESRYSFRRQ